MAPLGQVEGHARHIHQQTRKGVLEAVDATGELARFSPLEAHVEPQVGILGGVVEFQVDGENGLERRLGVVVEVELSVDQCQLIHRAAVLVEGERAGLGSEREPIGFIALDAFRVEDRHGAGCRQKDTAVHWIHKQASNHEHVRVARTWIVDDLGAHQLQAGGVVDELDLTDEKIGCPGVGVGGVQMEELRPIGGFVDLCPVEGGGHVGGLNHLGAPLRADANVAAQLKLAAVVGHEDIATDVEVVHVATRSDSGRAP